MRGSLRSHGEADNIVGIIPAHAGLTAVAMSWRYGTRDHPRACGAHDHRSKAERNPMGSSPRMRGSPLAAISLCIALGIIPAHAGLTFGQYRLCHSTWDHPRACGAHFGGLYEVIIVKGSSPRMRGSRTRRYCFDQATGIIPAHAGLTHVRRTGHVSGRDHPRACGAHIPHE